MEEEQEAPDLVEAARGQGWLVQAAQGVEEQGWWQGLEGDPCDEEEEGGREGEEEQGPLPALPHLQEAQEDGRHHR
eukprot:16446090-Heterocapsa_arctica.AAC.1